LVLTSLRQALRSLRRSPASAIAAVVTLALTLASATAIFAVVDATLLTPPPFVDPDALAVIGEVPANAPASAPRAVPARILQEWRTYAGAAIQMEAYDPGNVTLTGGPYPERVSATLAAPGLFALLGVTPRIGRSFSERDAADGAAVIVSDEFWRTKLLADPNPLGKTLIIGGQVRAIVGVLPPAFMFGLNPSSLWLPLNVAADNDGPRVYVVGRLSSGVTPATASALLGAVPADSARGVQPAVLSLNAFLRGRASELMPLLIFAAALGVGLATINLAGLLMLRAMDRARELAVRAALGARRAELIQPLLIEAHLLVLAGACSGVLLALWITPAAAQLAMAQLGTAAGDVAIGWRAAMVLIAVALTCAWLSALGPALAASKRFDLRQISRDEVSASPAPLTVRRLFVASEIAVAFVLLAAVLLVGRSLQRVIAIAPGVAPDGVLTAQISLPRARYRDARAIVSFYEQLEEGLRAHVGPGRVAIVDELPLTGSTAGRIRVAASRTAASNDAVARVAGRGYFELLQIPVIEGRTFDARDSLNGPPGAVISRSLADLVFPNTSSVGHELWLPAASRSVEILGVVGDVKHRSLEEETMPTLYLSAAQQPSGGNYLVLKTGRPDADILDIVRAEVARLDPELPIYAPRTLDAVIAASAGVPVRRVVSTTFAAFALLALVIAAVGVFGVVAHDVSARRLEMALRLALGAHPRRLQSAVLRQASVILLAGLSAGLMSSLLLSRVLDALLYGVTATDTVTIAAVSVLLSATMLVAAILPARRAARTNPVDVLRVS
jgi:putative ABC transport system permease protein